MGRSQLVRAQEDRRDEFYTRGSDIAEEFGAYLGADPGFLRGKAVYCPCDLPGAVRDSGLFVSARSSCRMGPGYTDEGLRGRGGAVQAAPVPAPCVVPG